MVCRCLQTLMIALLSMPCLAKVNAKAAKPVEFPEGRLETGLTEKDIIKIIPMDMEPTEDQNAVATKIGDRAVQAWLNSPAVKDSAMGKTASQVENAMKTEVAVSQNSEEGTIDHRFMFQLQAFQSLAILKYRGWVNAEGRYDARAGASVVELTERLWTNKDFVMSHTASHLEEVSAIGVRWSF